MTPQEQLHADIVFLLKQYRDECGSPHKYATEIMGMVRSRVEVVTLEMLGAGQAAWLNDPLRKSSTLFRAMLAASALGRKV